ncbi:hypothetical protein CCACVL1_30116 [Corchorus capsularis]|uniref:Uncharacterized protein n=1 Tax=Corchorus capsularis TaxID=210143 RepID=A0A1R3FYN9_COCAP|nr:hypothetical protein CCACVL1_30116 [Corchorus capsularis]
MAERQSRTVPTATCRYRDGQSGSNVH